MMSVANYPEEVVERLPHHFKCGVYYGWAKVDNGPVHKMVMSIGWNPQYQNTKKSMVSRLLLNKSIVHCNNVMPSELPLVKQQK